MSVKRKKISSLSTFETLMCYICKKFVEAPATISCGHHFCHTCLLKKLELKPSAKCPACNKTIKKNSVITNSKLSKIFQELKNLSQQQQESKEQESGKKPALKATKGHKRARTIKCKKRQIVYSDSDSDFEISPANKTTSFTAPAKKLLSTRQKWYEDNSSSGSSIRAIIRDDLEFASEYARTYSSSPELVDLSPACSPAVLEKKIVPEETYAQDAAEIHSRDESVPCKSIIEPEKELESESDSDGFIENTPKRSREAKKPGIRTPLSSPMKLAMPISICFSGLNSDSIKQVEKFMKRFKQVQCSNNFIPATTTHVIVHHEENMRASSTRKFLLAIACGRWVVSEKWISCCLQADKILPEEPYEMLSSNGNPSPKSARLSAKKLFHDFEIYCGDESRSYTVVTKKEMEEIVSCAGATVINQIQLQQSKTKKYRIVIIPTDEVPNDVRDCRFLVLFMDWIIDSIEKFRLASVTPFMARTIDDLLVSEQNFPPEVMEIPEDYTVSYSTADSTNVTSNSITHDTKS